MSVKISVKDLLVRIELLNQMIEITNGTSSLSGMLNEIAKMLSKNLSCDSCLIYLMDEDKAELVLSGTWPPHPYQVGKLRLGKNEGITGWVASHKKPVALSKNAFKDPRFKMFRSLPEDKFSALLSLPILLRTEPIGVINIMNSRAKEFSAGQIKILTNIASQLSGAIEKTRLMALAERKVKQLETIAQLSRTIVSDTYFQEILQLIVTMTAQMMGSTICSLMLYNEKKDELYITATQSLSEEYRKKPPVKVGQSVSGQVLRDKKPIAVLDVTKEPAYGYPDLAIKEGLRSMLAVPMMIKDKPIGVINTYTTEEHYYTDEEIRILQTVANQAAVAIENTRLLEEAKTNKEALETRKIIERAKGILMKERNLSEPQAFQFIQKQAMNLRRTMKEVAEAVLLTQGLKDTQ